MDAIFIATKAALFNTRIPKTQIQDMGDGEFEFEVLDDVEDAERLEGVENVPVGVTLNKVWTILNRVNKLDKERRSKQICYFVDRLELDI